MLFTTIFLIGICGLAYNVTNFFTAMLCIELMYLGIIGSFLLICVETNNYISYIYGLIILILAACESAIGLGILIILYRLGKTIKINSYIALRG